jgi:hypothetical protein
MEKLAEQLSKTIDSPPTLPRTKAGFMNAYLDRETPEMLERRKKAVQKLKSFLD